MAKLDSLAFACMFILLFGSCQSLEQIPIEYVVLRKYPFHLNFGKWL